MLLRKFLSCATVLVLACDVPEETEEVRLRDYPVICDQYNASFAQYDFKKEMFITKTQVVEDPCRTTWVVAGCGTKQGKWTAWHLFSQMVGGGDPSVLIHEFFTTFYAGGSLNGHPISARNGAKDVLLGWRKASMGPTCLTPTDLNTPCALDRNKSPFRLNAIVNRIDLRGPTGGLNQYGTVASGGGEGRFVFGFLGYDAQNNPTLKKQGNIIFEYGVPTDKVVTPKAWGDRWHALKGLAYENDVYNTSLQTQITDRFAAVGNLLQVRTNEISFDLAPNALKAWSLREYELRCPVNQLCTQSQKRLFLRPVAMTPQSTVNDPAKLPLLGSFLFNKEFDILGEKHTVPPTWNGQPFQGSESIASKAFASDNWVLWGVNNETFEMYDFNGTQPTLTRERFGLATCNGCHYTETRTDVMFVMPRDPGFESALAPFLTTALDGKQTVVIEGFDDVPGFTYDFNEPRRRVCELIHARTGASTVLTKRSGAH